MIKDLEEHIPATDVNEEFLIPRIQPKKRWVETTDTPLERRKSRHDSWTQDYPSQIGDKLIKAIWSLKKKKCLFCFLAFLH